MFFILAFGGIKHGSTEALEVKCPKINQLTNTTQVSNSQAEVIRVFRHLTVRLSVLCSRPSWWPVGGCAYVSWKDIIKRAALDR